MAEWLKALAWKAGVPQKGTGGSNPSLSADEERARERERGKAA
jgi:hypothetical protein